MKRVFFLVAIIAFLSGCVPTTVTEFVVLRDVPMEPSFTVIPSNFYYNQISFSHEIEEALIQNGVRTLHFSEATKKITEQKGTAKSEQGLMTGISTNIGNLLKNDNSAEVIRIETYLELTNIKAQYLIYSNVVNGRIRLVHKETLEILASHELGPGFLMDNAQKKYLLRKTLHDMLGALGFQVRDLPAPPETTTESTKTADDSY